MKIDNQQTDEKVLEELGQRLAAQRLGMERTQAQLAEQAGVSKRTLERMEAGDAVQLPSFIRALRALDLLPRLDTLLPEPGPRPMDLLKLQGKKRQRAPARHKKTHPATSANWRWGNNG